MKKKILMLCMVGVLSILGSMPALAQGFDGTVQVGRDAGPVLLSNMSRQTIIEKSPRGQVISSALLTISNVGEGAVGVYIQTLTHTPVDKTTFGVFLDRWIESENRWTQVTKYNFSYVQADDPNDDLSQKALSFKIVGQPSDCYYRLRGFHFVEAGDIHEVLSTCTDGILITK